MKLDLHTHIGEDRRVRKAEIEEVRQIIEVVKAKGLDGIALTEHYNKGFGRKVKAMVERHFDNEILVIPGWEIERKAVEIVELDLPGDKFFRFMVHPGCPYHPGPYTPDEIIGLHGIEIGNGLHDAQMNRNPITTLSEEYNLILVRNSDAHRLEDVGCYYNEIDFEELCSLAGDGYQIPIHDPRAEHSSG